jgi:hypothetical protein
MRIDLLEAFGLDSNVIAILKGKYCAELLPVQERAFKEYQILNGGNFLISAVLGKSEALAHHLSHSLNLPPAAGAIAEMNALEESVSKDMLITFLSSGVAVHNADLSWEERDIVERYTRKGEIRVICTTTTLAVGLNLPMKNAIVAPLRWKYFRDTRSLSKERILVSDYENMGGRVARYGFVSDFGRSIFVTSSYVDHKFYTDHYVKGPVEEMTPALNRKEMDRHILNLVASEICRDAGEIKTFLKGTFTGQTLWKSEMTDADYDKAIEETKPVFQSVWKISGMLSQEKERAVKKALMMSRWISSAETKEIEESYEVFSWRHQAGGRGLQLAGRYR